MTYTMTDEARRLRSAQARAAALQGAAMRDNKAQGHIGQQGLTAKYYAEIDARFPDITQGERERKMKMLRQAQMIRVRSARTRKDFRANQVRDARPKAN